MPVALEQQISALATRIGNVDAAQDAALADMRVRLARAVETFAAQSDQLARLAAWATEQGYDPSNFNNGTSA